jgi:hypothetical protein
MSPQDYDIENQCFGSGSITGSGSRVLMTKNWKKFTAKIKIFLKSKIEIYLSLGLRKGRPG